MKRLLGLAAACFAALCFFFLPTGAKAIDYSDLIGYDCEYDSEYDLYWYYDPNTGALYAVEDMYGNIYLVSDLLSETEEATYTEEVPYTEEEWFYTEEVPAEDPEPAPADIAITSSAWDLEFKITVSKYYRADDFKVYRVEGSKKTLIDSSYYNNYDGYYESGYGYDDIVEFADENLQPNTQYSYVLEMSINNSHFADKTMTLQFGGKTAKKPESPKLVYSKASQDSLFFAAAISKDWKADGFVAEKYNSKTKKWEQVEEGYLSNYAHSLEFNLYLDEDELGIDKDTYEVASFAVSDLKSLKKYKFRIRFYRNTDGERDYLTKVKFSEYTLMKAPTLSMAATSSKVKLSWSKSSKAAGYEVYVCATDPTDEDSYYGWYYYGNYGDSSLNGYDRGYVSSTIYGVDESQFKKKETVKSGTSASYKRKGDKVYVYMVRAYRKVNGKKVYSEFSNQVTTDSTSAMLAGVKINKTVTVSGHNLELVKAAVNKCVTKGMTTAQKAVAIYDYVHNAAYYEYDYTKINADPIVAILEEGAGQCYQYAVVYQAMMKYVGIDVKLVHGKTSSGGEHWWNQITLCGVDYMIDPQVGGRFVVKYSETGVTIEKIYD